MTTPTPLAPLEVHLWQTSLAVDAAQTELSRGLLNADELKRAARLISAEHQRRYIVARGVLRTLVGKYMDCAAADIEFHYTEQGKPFLPDTDFRFNISHSDEMAVYAFTRGSEIGVDIEKVEAVFKGAVAKRFFTNNEYECLTSLFGLEQERGFYRMWARKEALLKGVGEGLRTPLDSFSVNLQEIQQLTFEGTAWHIQSFKVDPDYEAAFAIAQTPQKVSQFIF